MNAEEPLLSQTANIQLSTTGTPLVEECQQPVVQTVPRPISILNLIHQWQPMGIRVVVDLPFIGDDFNHLFVIRNGPFIPRWDMVYHDQETRVDPDLPPIGNQDRRKQYAWNNMRNVYPSPGIATQNTIHVTQYDYPPVLASLAQCFRRWRGDMQYRIRTIAGFATQGYIIVSPLKNAYSPIGVYDEYKVTPPIRRPDRSYRNEMMNSYVMADTSMFRHIEVTCPYEYPVPYYDQFAWMSRRISPKFLVNNTHENPKKTAVLLEPHGDNWLCVGLRGTIGANTTGAQIIFELEYRAVEGFQFADPCLPLHQMNLPYSIFRRNRAVEDAIKSVPDSTLNSDGVWAITKSTSINGDIQPVQARATQFHQGYQNRAKPRSPREAEFS